MRKVATDEHLKIILATDSLALPRPWNQKKLTANPEAFFRYEDTYPYLMRRRLEAALPRQRLSVFSLSSRGGTFNRTKVHAQDLFSWMGGQVAIIHFGVVDCWRRPDGTQLTKVEDFEKAAAELIENHAKMGPDVLLIVIGILPTNETMLEREPAQNENIAAFNEALRTHIKGPNVRFFDVETLYAEEVDDVLHLDGHHLSKTGHAAYAEQLSGIILDGLNFSGRASARPPAMEGLRTRAKNLISTGQFTEAKAVVDEIAAKGGGEALQSALYGEILFRRGDYEGAFAHLSLAAKHMPGDVALWNLTAITAFKVLPKLDALSYLTHAYALNPRNGSIAFRLVKALAAERHYAQALEIADSFEPGDGIPADIDDVSTPANEIRKLRRKVLERLGRASEA
ncbi:MAG: GDSL-type esterase/lipase family protein [Pseudomonadota bacterium]